MDRRTRSIDPIRLGGGAFEEVFRIFCLRISHQNYIFSLEIAHQYIYIVVRFSDRGDFRA